VISEILSAPGPTHSVFDVLAAAVVLLYRGPRVALLGFAGGGVVAPLRAMGFSGTLDVVDLDDRGERIFRAVSGAWRGPVKFELGEASEWLRRRQGLAVFNLLPVKGWTWPELVAVVGRPFRERYVVSFEEYENRLLVAGRALPTARQLSAGLRDTLSSIESKMADGIAVRTSR